MRHVQRVSASIKNIDNEVNRFDLTELKKECGKFFKENVEAKYKVEVQLGKDRGRNKSFIGTIQVYLSKSCLNGDGDEIVYPCADNTCTGYIEPCHIKQLTAFCPKCKKVWKLGNNTELFDTTFFRLPIETWCEAIAKIVRKLEMNTDIYLKFRPVDIRPLARIEMKKDREGTELAKARNSTESVIYPMSRLIRDTSSGKSLETCLKAFLNA